MLKSIPSGRLVMVASPRLAVIAVALGIVVTVAVGTASGTAESRATATCPFPTEIPTPPGCPMNIGSVRVRPSINSVASSSAASVSSCASTPEITCRSNRAPRSTNPKASSVNVPATFRSVPASNTSGTAVNCATFTQSSLVPSVRAPPGSAVTLALLKMTSISVTAMSKPSGRPRGETSLAVA